MTIKKPQINLVKKHLQNAFRKTSAYPIVFSLNILWFLLYLIFKYSLPSPYDLQQVQHQAMPRKSELPQ